jgi:hypothetical protein
LTNPPALPSVPMGAPTIPLTPELRAAYQDLYDKYEAAIESTTDVGALEGMNASQLDVDNILTKDALYRLEANTALYDALLVQINSTNDDLKKLKAQMLAIANGVAIFGDVLGAIEKVLTMVPGV